MEDKYLSIITNFGCHYTCPYCIVKNNDIDIPITTIEGLDKLKEAVLKNKCNIVSISGGGDPARFLYKNLNWYKKLKDILEDLGVPMELHTSYIYPNQYELTPAFNINGKEGVAFPYVEIPESPYIMANRIVYHLHDIKDLVHVKRYKKNQKIRVVFVVTDDMTKEDINFIAQFVKKSPDIDELSFRQRVDKNYQISYHLHDFLKEGHQKDWWYIEQADYNLYYAENRVSTKYEDFKCH